MSYMRITTDIKDVLCILRIKMAKGRAAITSNFVAWSIRLFHEVRKESNDTEKIVLVAEI